eukprot:CAMPEP_0181179428 /NCGR_PEP_ID=MMETSP1096-20121128/6256_1 /TAXON_ID=156174 ORGANISM="Chrysochromulina ericina, Strain CCMP281" /NCGR_SAMPLE_ID=MMETSP1096 /ASSEMBLY_ACC=CAM_ASM_000453 /LENGTH=338 /DNA_ID=CAMNT_0023267779 /DNA_START=25 /DNA_END=1043 /DNA_ORIENTATION=-
MSAMNITSVGVCLSQLDGANGRLDLNGGVPGLTYTPFPSIGQYHWGLSVSGITANGHSFGCARPPYCAAIVDSGTSLITLPTPLLTELTPLMNSVKADCSNMHELPTLYLSVNGRELKLPPQLWVMRVQDSPVVKKAVYNIPGYKSMALPFYTGQYADECFPAIEAMDSMTDHGPMIILGMPFLRAYAAVFDRTNDAARTIELAEMPLGSDQCSSCSTELRKRDRRDRDATLTALEPPGAGEPQDLPLLRVAPGHIRHPWHARTAKHSAQNEVYRIDPSAVPVRAQRGTGGAAARVIQQTKAEVSAYALASKQSASQIRMGECGSYEPDSSPAGNAGV